MKIFFAPEQLLHAPLVELNRGELGPPFEHAGRATHIVTALEAAAIGAIETPRHFPESILCRVHDTAFVDFLRGAHDEWRALGRPGDALPICWPGRSEVTLTPPESLDGRLGHYSFDVMTPITSGSWAAVTRGADTALAGAAWLAGKDGGGRSAFSLCRPPGHDAGRSSYGGYCFLNNAAIAAQYLRDEGAERVAILDVDYHHGNGTQQIFYDRDDVLYVSIHADPSSDFPYFAGYRDELGRGAGDGFNHNLPLPRGTAWAAWNEAMDAAEGIVRRFAPEALVVSLGVDNFAGDPLSHFRFKTEDFARMGRRVAGIDLPTLIVFEGGYAVDELGNNVVSFFSGFEGA
ncbi:histone deacetylase family protein [Sphingomonas alpina]|uniref:Histone deacetylase family protein n=1 Tax=Sphingomonas alpina TaxID=653931 RepID=A0A7H0LMB1_9SPHN|nr:histone deacetylase family protein [Sphingomonas alpina]QNQ10814.1 histone deacetylase family protein [Sphingomonas alpina]